MENLDDSENNAKISDSAYSNSCSNSQSRRSHSSKSTHSGSNSSGSSGYGGKPSISTYSTSDNLGQVPEKRSKDKESKKKKQVQADMQQVEANIQEICRSPEQKPVDESLNEEIKNVIRTPPPVLAQAEQVVESMDICIIPRRNSGEEDEISSIHLGSNSIACLANRSVMTFCNDGFSCVISMHDGVVIYTTSSITTSLGFPKHMWIGRSFIDFVHPRDRNTFASQITNGLALPKNVIGMQGKAQVPVNSVSTMVCRIRRYRNLGIGFGVKERGVSYVPFLLKLSFKNITDEEGKVIYLVIQATQFTSAFRVPHESVNNAVPFVMRHAANGNLEYIDPESVPYLGYLPQDITDKDALQFYHPGDLPYLRQVYETIVREGGLPRSKPYRLLSQNGGYLKVETEWSSFINPWSKKLEFVIGKHHIIEGPANPDVFQPPTLETTIKFTEDEKNNAHNFRELIIRIMNEVLTKPAEVAKQHMSKRCQDLASFMESLIEEQPKGEDDLRLEIQDADHSYYERDSVMLGGISPHHDYNDSKSSTETPLSYNQLNYNENLQRYFDSHQPFSYEDYTVMGENVLEMKDSKAVMSGCLSPMAQNSGDSADMSFSESGRLGNSSSPIPSERDYHQYKRLTENILNKHNAEMEKELMKMHREVRSSSKNDREKASNETRQKKMEHLARCNTPFQPTNTLPSTSATQPHGVKRASMQVDLDAGTHKHHCASHRHPRRKQNTREAPMMASSTITTTVASQWPTPMNNMNTFLFGVGIQPQVSFVSPMSAVPGMFPLYYSPAAGPSTHINTMGPGPSNNNMHSQQPVLQCVMYGQALYGSQFLCPPVNPAQMACPLQDNLVTQTVQFTSTPSTSVSKPTKDQKYSTGCKALPVKAKHPSTLWRERRRLESRTISRMIIDDGSLCSSSSTPMNQDSGDDNCMIRSGKRHLSIRSSSQSCSGKSNEAIPHSAPSLISQTNHRIRNCEEPVDKTDGESSYSSFYSSFFKTDSGSAEESGDALKYGGQHANRQYTDSSAYYQPHGGKRMAKRKMEPPWMEQVSVTSELIYKYQILTKSLEEALKADKEKMVNLEQPTLVNEQLGQLYLDLQLEGVAARLTLEEGVSSSSSSGEESTSKSTTNLKIKREYSKLVMIYEEDMPFPPSEEELNG